MKKQENSCDDLRVLAGLERLQDKIKPEARRTLVQEAYSQPDLKKIFDEYDAREDEEDWSGIVGHQTCLVCEERYMGRGRGYSRRICDDCIEVHVSIRDAEIVRQEEELAIPLRVYGCISRE